MSPEYIIKRSESRTWYGALRFHWKIFAANGEEILTSKQGHSRRIDRETVIGHFYNRGCVPGVVELEAPGNS
jgi:uncharacterized protein YegP (UPF0339 family)